MTRFSRIAFHLATVYIWRLHPCTFPLCDEFAFPFLFVDGDPVCLAHAHSESRRILWKMARRKR